MWTKKNIVCSMYKDFPVAFWLLYQTSSLKEKLSVEDFSNKLMPEPTIYRKFDYINYFLTNVY